MWKSYFKWWKSWNSGDGRYGKWYPLWRSRVPNTVKDNHKYAVTMCDPIIIIPTLVGIIFKRICSIGSEYNAESAIGAFHSWCCLWRYLNTYLLCRNLKRNKYKLFVKVLKMLWLPMNIIKCYFFPKNHNYQIRYYPEKCW